MDMISTDTLTLEQCCRPRRYTSCFSQPLDGDPVPALELLIMTSGNRRSEPICLTNSEASDRLRGIADLHALPTTARSICE